MIKRIINLLFALLGVLVLSCSDKQSEGNDNMPNIIFIMTDDHTTRAVGCYGSKINQTPNIDKLADQGIRFTNAFVTNSICAPSRAVILTGKHSHLNGVTTNSIRFDTAQETFPKILRKNGYETAIVGKWHLQSQPTGFDYWNVLTGQGDYYNPHFVKMGCDTVYEGYATDITTDIALDWLSSRKSDKPFMLMLHHKAPHRNWMPHTKNLDRYEESGFPQPASFNDDYTGREHLHNQKLTIAHHMDIMYDLKIPCDTCAVADVNSWSRKEYEQTMSDLSSEQKEAWDEGYKEEIEQFKTLEHSQKEIINFKFQRYLQDYLRCILSVDENVGRVIHYVEQNGLADNTLIVYTSDQGFFLGEHGLFDKRYMYEESLQIPLVMRFPDQIQEGLVCNELVQNLDIAPTFLETAGIEIPEFMQGKSMFPLFKTPHLANWREGIYYHFYESGWGVPEHHGIRTKELKLIHFTSAPESWEFYDLENDPFEMKNLYHDNLYVENIEELKMKLNELQVNYKVPVDNTER